MRRLILAVTLVAAAASPVSAQLEPVAPAAPITAGWVFTPGFGFGVVRDTNPTTQNFESPTGTEMVATVSPRTSLTFNSRRARVSGAYTGTLERYQELAELTRYDQRGNFETRYQMTPRLVFEARNSFTVTPTTDQLEVEGLPFVRVGSRMVTSLGGFQFALSPRSTLRTSYTFQWVNFDRDAEGQAGFRFLQGGHSHMPSAEFEYAVTRRIKTGAVYSFRHIVIDGGEEIFGSHRAQATMSVQLAPSTSVYARAGFDYLTLQDDGGTESGPSYAGGISQRIGNVSITGAYERGIMPSFGFGGLTATHNLRAGVNVPMGRLFAGGSFTYRKTDPLVARDVLVELDSYWTTANVGYFVARWLRVEGFLNLNQQSSSARGDVDRTRLGILFVTSKPVRIQ